MNDKMNERTSGHIQKSTLFYQMLFCLSICDISELVKKEVDKLESEKVAHEEVKKFVYTGTHT